MPKPKGHGNRTPRSQKRFGSVPVGTHSNRGSQHATEQPVLKGEGTLTRRAKDDDGEGQGDAPKDEPYDPELAEERAEMKAILIFS